MGSTAKRLKYVTLAVLVSCLYFLPVQASETGPTVFAAASMKSALDDVAAAYVTNTGSDAPILIYAGSSALARQIRFGAPADVVISANVLWMDWLASEALINLDSRRVLLHNHLVLIATSDFVGEIALTPQTDLLDLLQGSRLAMAMVDSVPAGIYGRQSFETMGLWSDLKDHVAQADNVRAALRLVATGQAPLGVVYATDAAADPNVRIITAIDPALHDPILYPAALVASASHPDASDFLMFLHSDTAGQIFTRHGFLLPEAS